MTERRRERETSKKEDMYLIWAEIANGCRCRSLALSSPYLSIYCIFSSLPSHRRVVQGTSTRE